MIPLAPVGITALIFGGCCSNVYALEAIVKREPGSGLLITLFQFVLTALAAFPSQYDPSQPYYLKKSPVPFRKWALSAAMFFAVNMLNNWAFAFNISVPVHIILRSFGSVTTMAAGWLCGRKYSPLQTFSVALLTAGVIVSAWADAASKGKSMSTASINFTDASFEAGLVILLVAQLLSAYMGVYAQGIYDEYGKRWDENLFYSHFLSIPMFLPLQGTLNSQYSRLASSPPLSLNASVASSLPNAVERMLHSTPQSVFMLLLNAATQLLCISGVNLLSANTSAVTVTIVLNIRKLVSFLISIWLFGNKMGGQMMFGAALVFGAGALYGWETTSSLVWPSMSSPAPSVRHRGGAKNKRPTTPNPDDPVDSVDQVISKAQVQATATVGKEWDYKLALAVITVLAFATRFWGISHPDQVVFDEVHFGKFASYYLQRTYFFDVHPPFGKLLFALAGWLVGYDGSFLFENIGDSYITNKVPYVAYRAMPATMGALTVPTVFLIMWESGYNLPACITAAGLILFDNAHIGQTRLILLDATLVFSMALSVLSYVRFYKLRHDPFGRKWWKWLLLTGVCLSCVISTKYVGLFTFFSIGVPVAFDLWDLLNVNRRQGSLSLPDFGKHFAARMTGLIIIPFFLYLFWFQVHFTILSRSGPGDDFMSPEFQETLSDNIMTMQSVGIDYFDAITMRHKETKVYLHSHPDRYPLRYEDGRISSQGQQVTGYPHNDTNNQWQILPAAAPTDQPRRVKNGDLVRFRHLVTNTMLLTHDVASPYYPTNQEFTTVDIEVAEGERYNDTLFEIRVENGKAGQDFKTMGSHFKLVHFPTKVAMWTHTTPLPDWAYKQAEINGNKNIQQSSNIWYVEELPSVPEDDVRRQQEPRKTKRMPFLRKYLELQRAMFFHNNALTSSHPYASFPISWPFLLRGVSFWTENETRQQIYFLGNPLGWWLASSLLAVFAGIIGADQLAMRRGIDALDKRTRSRLYNSTGFFFLTWAAHYVPFFIMGRQLFLHHYLPAHLASCLVTGALVEFIFNIEPHSDDDDAQKKKGSMSRSRPVRERIGGQTLFASWAATGVILAIVVWSFLYFAPLTYGKPGLDIDQVVARKWLNYDLHFAK
ncbi:glycosyltransferase family 39 protein [Aplosporella prunicola CBS 121167]|uniref:Dolichyl-phosphate-mannose--protein mannosyltransferase 4 n=1 Tax=Aplosporella prunicola CBS 121167 TaxID=1176127 RepID=A0A6A6BRB6_9PEZI|nr:glycosyltransferase family 39 protein [Aplosporella prunicola CBS 121167]KAF2146639.1 glycosyltransferase family 39 protein [Aplosporella prunicola CBS 121167]